MAIPEFQIYIRILAYTDGCSCGFYIDYPRRLISTIRGLLLEKKNDQISNRLDTQKLGLRGYCCAFASCSVYINYTISSDQENQTLTLRYVGCIRCVSKTFACPHLCILHLFQFFTRNIH